MVRSRALVATILSTLAFLPLNSVGQLTAVTASTATPIPGAGHDYIKMLTETVDPASGSLSVRIQLPVPPSRGITIPFSFAYDSNGVHFPVNGAIQGQSGWDTIRDNGTVGVHYALGGWSYSVPMLTYSSFQFQQQGPLNCTYDATGGFVFQDESGGRHSLSLGHAYPPSPLGCSPHYFESDSGGDHYYQATLTSSGISPIVVDPDGTVYTFPVSGYQGSGIPTVWGATVEDRNGNIVGTTDTAGRNAVSWSGFGNNGDTVSVLGLPQSYILTWVPQNFNFNSQPNQWSGASYTDCSFTPSAQGSQSVIQSIKLPNNTYYQFSYDSTFAQISQITFPSGGYVVYAWGYNPLSALATFTPPPDDTGNAFCEWLYSKPAITDRDVYDSPSSHILHQHFSYSTHWVPNTATWDYKTTTVTTTDYVRGVSYNTTYTYGEVQGPTDPNLPAPAGDNEIPVETQIVYSSSSGSALRTVTKGWLDQYRLACELDTTENGLTSGVFYSYGQGAQVTDKKEYDYGIIPSAGACANGSTAPSGIRATRETATAYQVFPSTPIYPYARSILDKPCKIVVYGVNGKIASETDYLYDGGRIACGNPGAAAVSYAGGSGLTGHDETNYSAGSAATRGNLTAKIERLSTGASSTTVYTYDETGQVTSMTDANGNVTQYSYADQFVSTNTGGYQTTGGSPPNNMVTNAYLTQVTRPATATSHIVTYMYGYNDGAVTTSTDENIPHNTITYRYNDSLGRLTETDYPDGGQKTLSYNDSAPSPSITTTTKVSSTVSMISVEGLNGVGRDVQTQLADPEGTTTAERTYTGTGWLSSSSNPHRSTSSATDGTTSYLYDELGRIKTVTQADNSKAQTVYATSCAPNANSYGVTVTDEGGKSRTTCTDGLGRLTSVFEDPTGLNYETDYQYDALNNLLSVTQKGGSSQPNWRLRTFTYDWLSRLLSATNPESGTVQYQYDANGNLMSKTDARGVQTTMTYDVLNRLTSKSYSDGTPTANFYYDTPPVPWGTGIQNTNGRLVEATTGITPEP